jgi:hypothetical protein
MSLRGTSASWSSRSMRHSIVLRLLRDYERYPELDSRIIEARILERLPGQGALLETRCARASVRSAEMSGASSECMSHLVRSLQSRTLREVT